jgi:Acetyltransferase (isoleucine patch superfamily)
MGRLSSLVKKIRADFGGYFFYALHSQRSLLLSTWCTGWVVRMLRIKGIEVGKGCHFYGWPVFVRVPFSKIYIGDGCTFRSDRRSNLIGVNHKSIISTHSKKASITIGKNCGFSGVVIGAKDKIVIGDNAIIGANVIISDFDWHNTGLYNRKESCVHARPVTIEENVFVGVNSVIWKGVTIGKNAVVGANSVVTKDVPANCIVAGNPAKPIKYITET